MRALGRTLGKILGIDYGRKKIGLAIGETGTGLVEPIDVLPSAKFKRQSFGKLRADLFEPERSRSQSRRPERRRMGQIAKLCQDNDIKVVVVGITGGEIDEEIKSFGEKLKKKTGLAVDFFDETLTTLDAQKILGQIGRNKKYKKTMEDAIAAAVMLKSYLERGNHV